MSGARLAVVGAGIAGLACAHRLATRGHRVTVYEREPRPGGRMSTVEAGGFRIDIGTNLLVGHYHRLQALLAELGIADQWFEFQVGAGGVLRDQALTSFTPQSLLEVIGYQGLSLASRLELVRYFLGTLRWQGELDFFDLSAGDDELDGIDAYSWTRDHVTPEVAEYLVDPFIRTFHFHGAHHLSMKYFHALAVLFMTEGGFRSYGLRDLMIALPRALASRLDVRFGTPVRAVAGGPGGVVVETTGKVESFDQAVLAVPGPVARRLLLDPGAAQAELLTAVRYSSTLSIAYAVPRAVVADFEGIWVPWKESRIVSEGTNETCKGCADDRDCVLNLAVHEEAARGLLTLPDPEAARLVADEWGRLFPAYAGKLRPLHVQRWRHALPVYGPGTITKVKRLLPEAQGAKGIWFAGDWLNSPWVEGALRGGERTADRIHDALAAGAPDPA